MADYPVREGRDGKPIPPSVYIGGESPSQEELRSQIVELLVYWTSKSVRRWATKYLGEVKEEDTFFTRIIRMLDDDS